MSSLPASPAPVRPPRLLDSLRAVVHRGLRDYRRSPLTWGLPLGAACALVVAIYPSVEDSLREVVEGYPEGLKQAFNIGELDTVEAYLDAEMMSLIVPLAVGFFAVRSVTRALSVAEERRHLDIVLATPLSRRGLVAGSFLTTGVTVATVLAVAVALTWLAGAAAGTGLDLGMIVAGFANVWPLAMFFAGVAILATGFLHRSASVTAVAGGSLLGMYVLDLVGKIADSAEPLRWASAFRYYGSAISDGIDPLHFGGLTLAAGVLAAIGTALFERRDLLG